MPAELSGDVIVQLRDKALTGRGLYDAACALRARVGPRARVVVNGRADVARASGADGVHLPAAGLPIEAVRAWWPDALIGRSTHTADEARVAACAGADYLTGGPPYPTPGKAEIGMVTFADLCRAAGDVPMYALGGVTPERVAQCRRAGATGVACIRAVWDDPDPAAAIRRFLEA